MYPVYYYPTLVETISLSTLIFLTYHILSYTPLLSYLHFLQLQPQLLSQLLSPTLSGKTGRITVVGPDAQSVQAAREALELFEERHVLKVHQIEYLSRDFSMLEDIKGRYGWFVGCMCVMNVYNDMIGHNLTHNTHHTIQLTQRN